MLLLTRVSRSTGRVSPVFIRPPGSRQHISCLLLHKHAKSSCLQTAAAPESVDDRWGPEQRPRVPGVAAVSRRDHLQRSHHRLDDLWAASPSGQQAAQTLRLLRAPRILSSGSVIMVIEEQSQESQKLGLFSKRELQNYSFLLLKWLIITPSMCFLNCHQNGHSQN